jgi:hypothetical protein
MSFGNVISGDRGWMSGNATLGGMSSGWRVALHEIFHGPQSGVLGLAYGILHGMSQGLSFGLCGDTHQCNALERFLHPYASY